MKAATRKLFVILWQWRPSAWWIQVSPSKSRSRQGHPAGLMTTEDSGLASEYLSLPTTLLTPANPASRVIKFNFSLR